jgi:hypothetical protein
MDKGSPALKTESPRFRHLMDAKLGEHAKTCETCGVCSAEHQLRPCQAKVGPDTYWQSMPRTVLNASISC